MRLAGISWNVVPHFVDNLHQLMGRSAGITPILTLAQNLSNGKHRLQLRGKFHPSLIGLRVYKPPV